MQEGHVFEVDLIILQISNCEVVAFGQNFEALAELLLSKTYNTDFVKSVAISDAKK